MIKQQKDVQQFHIEMGLTFNSFPTMLDDEGKNRRIRLIVEELDELIDALDKEDMIETIDAIVDLLYVTYGTAVELGVNLELFWDEIQRSNMTKTEGYLNSYGKWVKPENHISPDIKGLFEECYGN